MDSRYSARLGAQSNHVIIYLARAILPTQINNYIENGGLCMCLSLKQYSILLIFLNYIRTVTTFLFTKLLFVSISIILNDRFVRGKQHITTFYFVYYSFVIYKPSLFPIRS